MEKKHKNIEILQDTCWANFQESVGKKTYHIENDNFLASIIEHKLPIVGKYMYIPRGPIALLEGEEFPISNFQFSDKSQNSISNYKLKSGMQDLIELTRKENAGWIRIEPKSEELLKIIKENIIENVIKAPHDVQPREIFAMDISKSEEQLLAEMKSKTRYNIKLAQKHGVLVQAISNFQFPISNEIQNKKSKYINAFLKLTKEMADRQGIKAHPEEYYRKMIATLPGEMLKIYVAEYNGRIIAANLVLFFGETATYLHGASSDSDRNVMAPFLLQWQAIIDAKEKGCKVYDFGGIKTSGNNSWQGITKFKTGFSPITKPIVFPGSYDIIVNPRKYAVYRGLQSAKAMVGRFRR